MFCASVRKNTKPEDDSKLTEGFVFFPTDSTKQSVSRLLPGHRISFVV